MTTPEHILIVDDDAEIRSLLSNYLQKNGYRTTSVAEGKGMLAALDNERVDLIVLDLMLPGDDGLVLCRNLRVRSDIPVIMLTARGEDMDRILGLEMGADDYLPKPFNPRELLARIKSILRRAKALPGNREIDVAARIDFAGWELDTISRQLVSPQGMVVPLSGSEYRLLQVFLNHPNRILSRDQLMELMRGRGTDPFERSIDVQVSRLRHRLADDAKEPAIIKTVRGEGYILSAQVETGK
ncbi:MAG TPA: response regulator [Thiobacillus sp.]|jgi:two-component system OmpR family response regulator|nr:response regulator [Thiobacillus sp.]